jgi:hypothetical protein
MKVLTLSVTVFSEAETPAHVTLPLTKRSEGLLPALAVSQQPIQKKAKARILRYRKFKSQKHTLVDLSVV